MATKKSEMSQDTKTIITILLLVFAYPVGLIMMFVWMDWAWWIKLLVVLIPILPFMMLVSFVIAIVLASINPTAQLNKANDTMARNEAMTMLIATETYYAQHKAYPWGNKVGYESSDAAQEAWYSKLTAENSELLGLKNQYRINQSSDGVQVCYKSLVQEEDVCVP